MKEADEPQATSEVAGRNQRIVIRAKATIAVIGIGLLFWVPVYYWVRDLPYRYMADEYSKWWDAMKTCAKAARYGEKQ